jgi:peptide/nickel transport system permease protein
MTEILIEDIELDLDTIKNIRKKRFIALLHRFFSSKSAMIGGSIALVFVMVAVFASLLAPHDPYEMNTKNILAELSVTHPFGTDEFGRDILSRVFYGARISMRVGLISTTISVIVGLLIGSVAGYYGKWPDNLLMRAMDALFAFPAILLAIVLVAILGAGINNAMIAIGIVYTPIFARIVRSAVIAHKESDYVEAARAIGQSHVKILFSHIMPNCMAVIIVQVSVTFAEAIIFEAGLSFIGLGAQPPAPSWGKMLTEAKGYMSVVPLAAIAPGAAISMAVLGFNLLGDGLRDVFDPRLFKTKA